MTFIEKLIKETGEPHNLEVVRYGFETIIDGVIDLVIIVLLGIVLHQMPATLIYVGYQALVSSHMGKYHATTKLRCLILTVITWFMTVYISTVICNYMPFGCVLASSLFYMFCIFLLVPAEHPEKQMSEEERIQNRNISLLYNLILSVCIGVLWWSERKLACVIWINMTIAVIFMLIGKIVYRNKN